jgi:hypothetical protein
MIIHLINIVDSIQWDTQEHQWLGWLRGSMICSLAGRGDPRHARCDYQYINRDLTIGTRGHVLELSSQDSGQIPILMSTLPSSNKLVINIFLAGEVGWQVMQRHRWNRNVRLHWIGDQLPLARHRLKAQCTAYVPRYAVMDQEICDAKFGLRVVELPYMPAMASLIGSTQLRYINFMKESRTILEGKKRKGVPVYLLGECYEAPGKMMENALRDHEITLLLSTIDECLASKKQPLSAEALHQFHLLTARKARFSRQSYALSRWLSSNRVEPEGDDEAVVKEDDIIATMAENAVHLAYLSRCMNEHRGYRVTKRSLTIYPDFYQYSALCQENYAWQLPHFFDDKASYLVVPAAAKACVSVIVSESAYQECRNRIWVILKEEEKAGHFAWVWELHEQGFFHVVLVGDERPIISMFSPGLDPEPMNGVRACWQAWKNHAQEEVAKDKIGSASFFAGLTACLVNRRKPTHPEDSEIIPRIG